MDEAARGRPPAPGEPVQEFEQRGVTQESAGSVGDARGDPGVEQSLLDLAQRQRRQQGGRAIALDRHVGDEGAVVVADFEIGDVDSDALQAN